MTILPYAGSLRALITVPDEGGDNGTCAGQAAFRSQTSTGGFGLGDAAGWRRDSYSRCQNRRAGASKRCVGEMPPLGREFMDGVRELYDRELRTQIHDRW
jgi:hypothetical protein